MKVIIIGLGVLSLILAAVCNILSRDVDEVGGIELITSTFLVASIAFLPQGIQEAKIIFITVLILNTILTALMATSSRIIRIVYRLFNALALIAEAILLVTSTSVNIVVAGAIGALPIVILIWYLIDYYIYYNEMP